MACVVTGSASAADTTIALPAHNIGDDIFIAAYRASGGYTPAPPAAGGTVPDWVVVEAPVIASNNSMGVWHCKATANDHTCGVWANTMLLAVVVCSGADTVHPLGGHASGRGSDDTGATAPGTDLVVADGSSLVLYFYGHQTTTSFAAAPAGYTRLTSTAGASSHGVCVNTRDDTHTAPAALQPLTSWFTGGFDGATVEVRARPPYTADDRNVDRANEPIPADAVGAFVTLQGGGGGGGAGGNNFTTGGAGGGGGGGGGGRVERVYVPVASMGATFSVSRGLGGPGAAELGGTGSPGGASTFTSGGVSLSAGGGLPGSGSTNGALDTPGGPGGVSTAAGISAATRYGSAGGIGSHSTNSGGDGGAGVSNVDNAGGGGGGGTGNIYFFAGVGGPGGGSTSVAGGAADTSPADAAFGFGGAGGGGGSAVKPGAAGGRYGGGGGGGGAFNTAPVQPGGAGGDGFTLVEWMTVAAQNVDGALAVMVARPGSASRIPPANQDIGGTLPLTAARSGAAVRGLVESIGGSLSVSAVPEGVASRLSGQRLPTPIEPPQGPPTLSMECMVSLHTVSGTTLYEFGPQHFTELGWGRRLRDVSACTLTLPTLFDESGRLADVVPWLHWITVFDTTGGALWDGPIAKISANRDSVTITARDAAAFASRTRNPLSKRWENVDPSVPAGEIWRMLIAAQSLNTALIVRSDPQGFRYDYKIEQDAALVDAEMTKLVGMGLSWTVAAGAIILGPQPRQPILELSEDDFIGGLELTRDGAGTANDVLLRGPDSLALARTPLHGLNLQTIVNVDSMWGVSNTGRATQQYAAYVSQIRDSLGAPSAAVLHPRAPLSWPQMVPSTRFSVSAYGQRFKMELQGFTVTVNAQRAEVSLQLETVTDPIDLPELQVTTSQKAAPKKSKPNTVGGGGA